MPELLWEGCSKFAGVAAVPAARASPTARTPSPTGGWRRLGARAPRTRVPYLYRIGRVARPVRFPLLFFMKNFFLLGGLALLLLGTGRSRAAGPPTPPPAVAAAASALAPALLPDGRLRPEARGSFDASGYQMLTAPDGHPVFRPAGATGARGTLGAGDENWQDGFGAPGAGLNGSVNALVVAANGDVLAGGDFTDAGGNPNADRIARWDGTAWQALGRGLDNQVYALALAANGDVLAGGDFTDAGGNPNADRMARWNGTAWQALGTGLNSTVFALAVAANGDVLAGGAFLGAGRNPNANFVARWDGTA